MHQDEFKQEELLKEIDAMDLAVAVKLLSSQYLNKKIQGLNDINEIISDVRSNYDTLQYELERNAGGAEASNNSLKGNHNVN